MVERDLHVDARADDAPWIREVTSTSASTEQARPRLSALLPIAAIRLRIPAMDWRAAVRASGEALVAAGITTPAYTDQMIATVEQLGPYIVIAPGIALAHARPSEAVLRPGLSWVTLAQPVRFGHKDNDPVTLIVGHAAPDSSSHVQGLATLAELLEDPTRRAALMAATTQRGRLLRRCAPRNDRHMKILAVCGMGLGSGLLLRMQAEKALRQLGIDADLEVADIGSARAMAQTADLILTSNELAEQLGKVK